MTSFDNATKVIGRRGFLAGISAIVGSALLGAEPARAVTRKCVTVSQCFNQNRGRCTATYGVVCGRLCAPATPGTQYARYRCGYYNANGSLSRCDTSSSVCAYTACYAC